MLIDPDLTVCPGDTVLLGNEVTGDIDFIEWTVLGFPPASEPILGNPSAAFSSVQFPGIGTYTFERCVHRDNGGSSVDGEGNPIVFNPSLGCPLGVIEGQNVFVPLNDATGATVTWNVVGPATGVPNGNTGIAINANGPGTITVTGTVVLVDLVTGEETTETVECQFESHPVDTEFTTQFAQPVCFDVADCGRFCECEQVTIVVRECTDGETCITLTAGFVVKDCEACQDEDVTPYSLVQPTVGSSAMTAFPCPDDEIIEIGCLDEELCCLPHKPRIIWKDACALGWEITDVTGAAEPGFDASALCACNPSQRFCFRGTIVLQFTGPPTLLDTLVIHGHNLGGSLISTAPFTAFGGNPVLVGNQQTNAGVPATSQPVVIYFDQVNSVAGTHLIQIVPDDPNQLMCIDNIMLGAKLELPEDVIPTPWTNPHTGMKRKVNLKRGRCGIVSVTTEIAEKTIDIPIKCITEGWAKVTWRALMDYLDTGAPLGFAWSIEQCPEDIFWGYVDGCHEGTQYDGGPYQSAVLTLTGYTGQPQTVDFI